MSKKLLFWWIDDRPLVLSQKKQIERDGVRVEVHLFGKENPAKAVVAHYLDAKAKSKLPQLVIIDEQLTTVATAKPEETIRKGSSLAVVLREHDSMLAIVGITGNDPTKVSELQREQYIEFFYRDELWGDSRTPELVAVAQGFQKILKLRANPSQTRVLRALDCPKAEGALLWSCIPVEFKKAWDDDTPHSFARWTWHTLLSKPGFLYDELEVATMLGLSIEGLRTIEAELEDCLYRGVMAAKNRPRWWVSKVMSKVRASDEKLEGLPLHQLGRGMLKDSGSAMLSKAYGRATDVPNIVAFKDGSLKKRVQARIEDTKIVDGEIAPVGFEAQRVYVSQHNG